MNSIKALCFMLLIGCSAQAMEKEFGGMKIYYSSSQCGESICAIRAVQAGLFIYAGYTFDAGRKESLANAEEIWNEFDRESNSDNKVYVSELGNS